MMIVAMLAIEMAMGTTKNTFATLTHIQPARAKTFNYPVVEKYHLWKVNLPVGLRSCKCFPRLFRIKDADSNSSGHCLVVLFSFPPANPVLLQSWSRPLPCPCDTVARSFPIPYMFDLASIDISSHGILPPHDEQYMNARQWGWQRRRNWVSPELWW